jgi:hypothetical protein
MMIAIMANTDVMTPKMIVPVESGFGSVKIEPMVEFKVGKDWCTKVVLSAGMAVAMVMVMVYRLGTRT